METIWCEACGYEATVQISNIPICEDCREQMEFENQPIEEFLRNKHFERMMHDYDMRRRYMNDYE